MLKYNAQYSKLALFLIRMIYVATYDTYKPHIILGYVLINTITNVLHVF